MLVGRFLKNTFPNTANISLPVVKIQPKGQEIVD